MNLTPLKPYFHFTRSHRIGLLFLFAIITTLQVIITFGFDPMPEEPLSDDDKKWLALQPVIDSMKQAKANPIRKTYPYNPNFITDEKGYALGMSVEEIDRLLKFRSQNKFANSAAEFQAVTKVSDSLLAQMSPNFKFPDWVAKKSSRSKFKAFDKPVARTVLDINSATAEDLVNVYGIGPALSERILKQRTILGDFASMEQIGDIWGISEEVVTEMKLKFKVIADPTVKKIAINEASVSELSKFPYFRYPISKNIVTYRSMYGKIKSTDDLIKIQGIPAEKVNIIAVYLEF